MGYLGESKGVGVGVVGEGDDVLIVFAKCVISIRSSDGFGYDCRLVQGRKS